jgi:hypothetical protein
LRLIGDSRAKEGQKRHRPDPDRHSRPTRRR